MTAAPTAAEVYDVEIRAQVSSIGTPELVWTVTAPDGRVVSGTTSIPAWRWAARRAARKAARWLARSEDRSERYRLHRIPRIES